MNTQSVVLRPSLLALPKSDVIFQMVALLVVWGALGILVTLLIDVGSDGAIWINREFLTGVTSENYPERAGIYPALVGSACLMLLTGIIAIPLAVGAAVFLEEYASKNWLTHVIELNIANLAAIPSIIYGLLGLQVFVRYFSLGESLLAAALTMSLLILPVIIIAAREAIVMVPRSIREGALALGATKWQTVRTQVLPAAFPGILTGCILAFSRAIGETAPLVTIGAFAFITFTPDSLLSEFTVLPIQAYDWISRPQEVFHGKAAAAIIVLLAVLLTMNACAIYLRMKLQRRLSS